MTIKKRVQRLNPPQADLNPLMPILNPRQRKNKKVSLEKNARCSGYGNQRAFYIVFISSSRRRFCSSVKVLHLENRSRCSSVNCIGSSPSEKNCDKVIPNARHTASRVGSVGALFRLNILVTVEWERPDSFASL